MDLSFIAQLGLRALLGAGAGLSLAWTGYMSKADTEFKIDKAVPILITGALSGIVMGLFGVDISFFANAGIDGFFAKLGLYIYKWIVIKINNVRAYLEAKSI